MKPELNEPMLPSADLVCTTREAAQLLGVSLRTAQLWVEQGMLEAWKTPGGHRRIRRASVEALLRAQRGPQPVFRLLLVEDDPDLLALYASRIAGWEMPLEIDTACNGVEGLLKLGANPPDLLITDLDMPGLDGVQMIRTVSARLQARRLRIVVVTALADDEITARGGLPAGVSVMRKPLAFDQLRGYLQACLAVPQAAAGVAAEGDAARLLHI